MNILKRLRRLEAEKGVNSEYCKCLPQTRFEIYRADLSEASDSSEPVLQSEPLPDICPDCRKTVEKRQIIFQFCDQTTKDRFPEEWNANRNK
jgi:hypothetical protein